MRIVISLVLLPVLAAAYYKNVGYIGPKQEQAKHNTFNCSTQASCVTEATKGCDAFAGCLSFGINPIWHGGQAAQLYLTDFNQSYKDHGWTLYSTSSAPPTPPPTPPPPPTPSPPTPAPTPPPPCTSDLGCSLNGVCDTGKRTCLCDKPWSGPSCGVLKYKTTPATGKNLYNTSDPRNTWNGPIVAGTDGKYHIYDPLYNVGSLGGPPRIMHGIADSVTGPFDWTSQKDICTHCGENPAAVVYKDPESGKTVYSLWVGGVVWAADSAYGPFAKMAGVTYPGGNPAPVFHDGAFYITNQGTTEVYTTPKLAPKNVWTKHGSIPHGPRAPQWHTEDPFMWVDKRKNWHVIGHAYDNMQFENCGSSTLSSHFFSTDGKSWNYTQVAPYSHTVQYDDGTSHTYTTLERPNLHFDASGQLTHINLAADLVTGDEGCASRTKHAHFGHTPCDNCKWDDHAGTTIIALDV